MLSTGALDSDDTPSAAAIKWLQGDRQGALETLVQPLGAGDDKAVTQVILQ